MMQKPVPFWTPKPTADLMAQAYAKARNFDIRPMTELSDHFINLRLVARFKTTLSGYVEYNLQILGISSYNSDQVALVAEDNTPFSRGSPTHHRNQDRGHYPGSTERRRRLRC